MADGLHTYRYPGRFVTAKGGTLHTPELAYTTYGNVGGEGGTVWVCHALTADSDVLSWWAGLFGEGQVFDPRKQGIICVNNPGSCYGSTGPQSIDPSTGTAYGHRFPELCTKDIALLFGLLRQHLGIDRVSVLVGASQGGQIAQECILTAGFAVDRLVLVATSARHSPWGIAFNESQRMCIETDATWQTDAPDAGMAGMKAARSVALLSYRSYETYETFQSDADDASGTPRAVGYQRYQGEKLASRFNAYSYHALSKTMDTHRVGNPGETVERALARIGADTLVVGIGSDLLFPLPDQAFLAAHIPGARLVTIDSVYGHDGFLTETEQLSRIIGEFTGSDPVAGGPTLRAENITYRQNI